jgi:hypothetical protein
MDPVSPPDKETIKSVATIVLSRDSEPNHLATRATVVSYAAIALATALTGVAFITAHRAIYCLLTAVVGVGWAFLPRRWNETSNVCFAAIVLLAACAAAFGASSALCILISCVSLAAWDLGFFARRLRSVSVVFNGSNIWRSHLATLPVPLLLGSMAAVASTGVRTNISWPKIALLAVGSLVLVLRVDANRRSQRKRPKR